MVKRFSSWKSESRVTKGFFLLIRTKKINHTSNIPLHTWDRIFSQARYELGKLSVTSCPAWNELAPRPTKNTKLKSIRTRIRRGELCNGFLKAPNVGIVTEVECDNASCHCRLQAGYSAESGKKTIFIFLFKVCHSSLKIWFLDKSYWSQ